MAAQPRPRRLSPQRPGVRNDEDNDEDEAAVPTSVGEHRASLVAHREPDHHTGGGPRRHRRGSASSGAIVPPTGAILKQPALVHEVVTQGVTVTQAVIELKNDSSINVGLQFRWNSSSAWTNYTINAGHYELLWINNSSSLAPQVQFDQSVLPGWQNKLYNLGYFTYTGNGGTPPTSAARLYDFQNVAGGVDLYSETTQAVTAFRNSSNLTVSFQFRWNTSSSFSSTVNLAPGHTYYFWTTPPNASSPQITFDQSILPGWQAKTYALNFNIYVGNGTPPISSASGSTPSRMSRAGSTCSAERSIGPKVGGTGRRGAGPFRHFFFFSIFLVSSGEAPGGGPALACRAARGSSRRLRSRGGWTPGRGRGGLRSRCAWDQFRPGESVGRSIASRGRGRSARRGVARGRLAGRGRSGPGRSGASGPIDRRGDRSEGVAGDDLLADGCRPPTRCWARSCP